MAKELGKHDFAGSCFETTACNTVSVGCFQWVARGRDHRNLGPKRGTVKVRVSGPSHLREQIVAKAKEICAQLDAGTYAGPMHVKVSA